MKKTVLIIAIALGFSTLTLNATNDVVDTSLNYEVKINRVVSPFCMSIVKGDLVTVKKLIEFGANVNGLSNGLTPVMYAAKYNRVQILKLLVENGARLSAETENGMTAKKFAKKHNASESFEYIKNVDVSAFKGVKRQLANPFVNSIVKGDLSIVKKLIELGTDVNETFRGLTPSMYASKYNRLEILKLLVENGANLKKETDKGMTAVKYAEKSNAKDVLAYIKG